MIELTNSEKVYLILERKGIPYTLMMTLKIDKELNIEVLKESIKAIFSQYPILTSNIQFQDKKYYLIENEFDTNQLFNVITQNGDNSVESVLSKIMNTPFDVYNDPIVYIYYIKINIQYYLAIRWFHSLFDGRSALIIINQILNAYIMNMNNEIIDLPELKRISYLDIIRDYKHIRDGVKIGSRLKLTLLGLKILFKLRSKKGSGGFFNKEDKNGGKLLFKTLNLTENIMNRLNLLKQKYSLTDNDLVLSIIIQAYINFDLENTDKKIRILTVMDVRPRDEEFLLGDLYTGFYVELNSKEIKDEITLIKIVKTQMDKEKESLNAVANFYIGEVMDLTLEKLRRLTKDIFKLSNMQVTNVGNLDHIIELKRQQKINILESSFFVPIKPGLSSVMSIIKSNNIITIGLSYLENVLSETDVDNFFNQILSVINKIGDRFGSEKKLEESAVPIP
ncbi:MAG: condensation domain-containing protein [Promethearchaeota archaeon]